jgi:hypothetical protein
MAILHEALLPSGRGVRYAVVDTEQFLDANDRAAEAIGGTVEDTKSAAYQSRLQRRQNIELMAITIKAITAPLEMKFTASGDVDMDAMLDPLPASSWKTLTPLELMSADSEYSVKKIFRDLADYGAMTKLLQDSLTPKKDIRVFTGKVRTLSV